MHPDLKNKNIAQTFFWNATISICENKNHIFKLWSMFIYMSVYSLEFGMLL